jgi:hypothetical protein
MTIYLGIDPGLNGSFGIIEDDRVYGSPFPTFWTTMKSGRRRQKYDWEAIKEFIEMHKDAIITIEKQYPMPMQGVVSHAIITIEKQYPMPMQGVVSQFSIGLGYGTLTGLLCGLGITPKRVHAKTWQKEFFQRDPEKTTKDQALEVVKELYPNVDLFATERSTVPHSGIVDSLLIAEWGKRCEEGTLKK